MSESAEGARLLSGCWGEIPTEGSNPSHTAILRSVGRTHITHGRLGEWTIPVASKATGHGNMPRWFESSSVRHIASGVGLSHLTAGPIFRMHVTCMYGLKNSAAIRHEFLMAALAAVRN